MLQYTILDRVKHPFVIYKDTFTNNICLDPTVGSNENRSLIITLPRSGSHFIRELFNNLNFHHVRMEYEKETLKDYRFLSDTDRSTFARLYDSYSFPFTESQKWIQKGQFIHTKLFYDYDIHQTLINSNYKVFLLKRNLKDCIVSHARCKQRENLYFTNDPSKLLEMYIHSPYFNELIEPLKLMLPWFEQNTFTVLDFETLVGQNGVDAQYKSIMKLTELVNLEYAPIEKIISKSVGKKTFTYTSDLSDWKKYWNDSIEEWFVSSGFAHMNKLLGYD